MNRRAFLASLLATAALDPEKLLWVPGARTIFVPPAPRVYTSSEIGVSIRFLRSYDIRLATEFANMIDVLYMPVFNNELAERVLNEPS